MKKKEIIIAVISALIILALVSLCGCTIDYHLFESAPDATVTQQQCATFSITPSVEAGNGQLNSDQDTVTVGFYANTTAHTIAENDNTTWVDTNVSFTIRPLPFSGATNDDIAVLYYTVTNPDQTVETANDTRYMVTKSGGNRQLVWTRAGTDYVSGNVVLGMTATETLYLTIDTAQTDMSYIENELDPQELRIEFSNGCGWTQPFSVKFVCLNSHH